MNAFAYASIVLASWRRELRALGFDTGEPHIAERRSRHPGSGLRARIGRWLARRPAPPLPTAA